MALRIKPVKGKVQPNYLGVVKKGRFPVVEKSRRTLDGIVFDSAAEMRRYATLKLGARAGMIKNLKRQVKFPVPINGEPFCTFTADFVYEDEHGATIVEDVKSSGTQQDAAYRLRKKAAQLFYGFTVKEIVA